MGRFEMKSTTEMDLSKINVGEIKGIRFIEPNDLTEEDEVEMNKKELTKKLMNRMQNFGYFPSFTNVKTFIREYEKLTKSEKQKPVVPQFVADWIEYCKRHNFTLFGCLDPVGGFDVLAGEDFEGDVRKCIRWCRNESDKLARAWIFGYEVEKEKRYSVVMKTTKQPLYYNAVSKKLFFSMGELVTSFTRKELEESNFGWVFDCPGIEIEEVEE